MFKSKKISVAALLAIASWMGANAATQLTLTLTDGSTPSYLLADKPVLTISGDDLVVTTAAATASYPRSSIEKIQFSNVDAAVETIEASGTQMFAYINGTIIADGAISVCDLYGRNVLNGSDSLNVSQLASGTYIVRTVNHTVKIAIR